MGARRRRLRPRESGNQARELQEGRSSTLRLCSECTSSMMAGGKPTDSKVCSGGGQSRSSTFKSCFLRYSSADKLKLWPPEGSV